MNNQTNIKEIVKEKYTVIAEQSKTMQSGCGCGCGSSKNIVDYTIMAENYNELDGYAKDADLGLGCGLPTEFANIHEGDIVIDLGSGAGNDVFIASKIVGGNGKVIGIDMTEEMNDLANENKFKLGVENVEFRIGEIENLPIDKNSADVIVSNCVLNLVPSKEKAFSEIYRTLKVGGHFCVSDIVLVGDLPNDFKKSAEMYAGCVAGAIQKDKYIDIIQKSGFNNIEIKKTKTITIPDNILEQYLKADQLQIFKNSEIGIFSITVVGEK